MTASSSVRLDRAQALLGEAVFQSRAKQAAAGVVQALGRPAGAAQCGLGREAAVELGLSERGREIFRELWPEAPAPAELERLRGVLAAWVARADQLDRDRNHFLKAFRQRHGFDRRAYTAEQLAAYEAGLAEVNGRSQDELGLAARALLG
jgi:hypothetical protein